METTLQRVAFPQGRRILITSDIHGHADDLKALLDKARFSPDDILVIIGDLIEKGTQSLATLRLVMGLKSTHTVYPLMGNVEAWRLSSLTSTDARVQRECIQSAIACKRWWGGSLLHEMCEEMGVTLTADTDPGAFFPALQRHFAPEIAFMAQLPTLLESQSMIFVHGGIPHERLDELVGTDAHALLKFDDFYRAGLSFQKYVAVGHWPAVLYSPTYPDFRPVIDRKRRILSIDGACGVKDEGQLNLLALPHWQSEDFSLFTQDHLPCIIALDSQAASPPEECTYIRWSDRWVTVLEKGKEMSRVRYGDKLLDVPTQYLGRDEKGDYCRDATDYLLPVNPGDELLLILPLSHGCLAKKDGIAGWYMGRYSYKTEGTANETLERTI